MKLTRGRSDRRRGAARPLARIGLEQALADADRFRRHLDQLVIGYIVDRLLQGHQDRRRQPHRLVLRSRADVGELLALQGIDLEIVVPGVLADHHALIDLRAGRDEHRPAILEVPQGIGDGDAVIGRDEDPRAPPLDRALIGRIAVEEAAHDAGAAGVAEELALIADEAAGRRVEGQALLAAARGPHVLELALAAAHLVDDDAGELLVDIDLDLLDRLQALAAAAVGLEEDARPRDRQLVALAPHLLYEDAQLQLAAPGDLETVLVVALAHADRDVALGLAPQALDDHPRGDLGP